MSDTILAIRLDDILLLEWRLNMATIRINQLPSGTILTDDDIFLVMDDPSGVAITKRVSAGVLRSSILNQAAQLQLRQGTNVERGLITPASGEPIWVTDQKKLYVGDATTVGGNFIGPYVERGIEIFGRDQSDNFIGGGQKNSITSFSSTIGGGYCNTSSASHSTVGGGYYNAIQSAAIYGTVAGGQNNNAIGSFSTIGGGGQNYANGSLSTIGGGGSTNIEVGGNGPTLGNKTYGTGSTVCGGVVNNAYGDYSTVIGGSYGKSTLLGQVSHAAGAFANQGDAQHSILIARRATTDATANTVLTLDGLTPGSTNRLTIAASTAWSFLIKIIAYNSTDNAAASWFLKGGIRRNAANGTTLIGSVTSETWTEAAMSTATVSAVADDTNEALEIRVTGIASRPIRWVAVVDITQVSFGSP
jgi:hypothetical protein